MSTLMQTIATLHCLLLLIVYCHLVMAELLLSKGADVNGAAANGATPLYMAAQQGHLAIAELLLSKGAGINPAKGGALCSPMYAAACCRDGSSRGCGAAGVKGRRRKFYFASVTWWGSEQHEH